MQLGNKKEAYKDNLLRVFKENCPSNWVLLQLVLGETFLIEGHLEVVVLFAQEALQVPIHSFGVLHRLKCEQ